jgi:hypothetical protein
MIIAWGSVGLISRISVEVYLAEYHILDPRMKLERIDSSSTNSFLSVRADPQWRKLVGGREAIFLDVPDKLGR